MNWFSDGFKFYFRTAFEERQIPLKHSGYLPLQQSQITTVEKTATTKPRPSKKKHPTNQGCPKQNHQKNKIKIDKDPCWHFPYEMGDLEHTIKKVFVVKVFSLREITFCRKPFCRKSGVRQLYTCFCSKKMRQQQMHKKLRQKKR